MERLDESKIAHVSDAIARLDQLLVDDPCHEGLLETLAVAGDLLQSRGSLRGEHIAHELALALASPTERQRRVEDYERWLSAHERQLFGPLHALRHRKGALSFHFRGGKLLRARLDLRRVIRPGSQLEIRELVELFVASPVMRELRELQVRVRHFEEHNTVQRAVANSAAALPLEVLLISPTTRPLGHHNRGSARELRETFPLLWLCTHASSISPVLDPELGDALTAHELELRRGAAMDRQLRVLVGRGLSSGRLRTTIAACQVIAGLGPSGRVFEPIIDLMLRPQVSHAAPWILAELPRFGAWAQGLLPRLRSITGDLRRYPGAVRIAAGNCIHELSSPR